MYFSTVTNPLSSISPSFSKNSIVGRLASGVSGDIHVVKKYATLQSLQKDEFISVTSDSKPLVETTYTKRKNGFEKQSNQITDPVVDESAAIVSEDNVANESVSNSVFSEFVKDSSSSLQSLRERIIPRTIILYQVNSNDPSKPQLLETVDSITDMYISDVRYNDMLRFYDDKAAKSKNGEHISAELLVKESLAMTQRSLSEWERTAAQREQYAQQFLKGPDGVLQNIDSDSLTLAKWKDEYYEYLKTTGKSFYSDVSQKEAEDKMGNSVKLAVGADTGKKQYLISIISYGNGATGENIDTADETAEIVFGSPDYVKQIDAQFQSKIKSPIMDILTANGITLNDKEGFTINVGIDGIVKLGDHNIKDETKIASIKQALESDKTLGQQLVNTCRNDSLFGIMACI